MAIVHRIDRLDPEAALPGGEIRIWGQGMMPARCVPEVRIAGTRAAVGIATPHMLTAKAPEGSSGGLLELSFSDVPAVFAPASLQVAALLAENLHPVANPAVDAAGNIFTTLSGTRGQKTPVSIFKVDSSAAVRAWSGAIVNPSGLAFDRAGVLFVSSRNDGAVYCCSPDGVPTLFAESLGIATGIAFDRSGDLYVGDRSGTIFKIDRKRNTFVFATLEPSVAAYHLAFGADDFLYVTGPSTSSHDCVWRINPSGQVEQFFTGLGRPQGLAFEGDGALLVVASYRGRRGVIEINSDRQARTVVSGNNLVGIAFAPAGAPPGRGDHRAALILATHNALYRLPWPRTGAPLPIAPIEAQSQSRPS